MFAKLFVLAVALSQVLGDTTDKQKLVGDLMKNYMKAVDPNDTPLKMALSYVCADLNPTTHQLTSKLLEKYAWTDNRLMWKPEEYGDIKHIRLPAKMIWTPDVKVYTTQSEAETRDEVNTVVFNNGTVLWIPMVTYKTHCMTTTDDETDRSTTCKIQIGSWTYDAKTLDLQLDGEGFDTYMYVETCPYTIHSHKVRVDSQVYPCCPEPYASMHIELKVTPRQ